MKSINFYQKHLNRVSRSFAFCIQSLEGSVRRWVSMTYLICRILDTVEDSPWGSNKKQLDQFQKFNKALADKTELFQLQKWEKEFPQDIPKGERLLLLDSVDVFKEFHDHPDNVKQIVQHTVFSMSRGMQHFVQRKQKGELQLKNLYEVNQYCFFVAGVVGEALSQFIGLVESKFVHSKQVLVDSYHFGLFLQKVNLLKDQLGDEKEGRFLVHSREEVLASMRENAEGAYRYLQSVPHSQKAYRLFCAWSFFIGLASLPHIEKAYKENPKHKISRGETYALVKQIEALINQPDKLEYLYTKLFDKIPFPELALGIKEEIMNINICSLYQGQLKNDDFYRLRVLA